MPVSECPHCHTQLWVKDTQLNIAQGFVVCSQCEGLFQAKDHTRQANPKIKPGQLPNAVTDMHLVRKVGPTARTKKTMSKAEIADLLDSMIATEKPAADAAAKSAKSSEFNWTMATLVALTVLIMQLFYLALML